MEFGSFKTGFHLRVCIALAALSFLLAEGCAVGPKYARPQVETPSVHRGETSAATNSLAELPWWEVFHDEQLRTLIQVALTNNFDVRIAAARVEQARAIVGETRSQFFPQVNYLAAAGAGRNVGASGTLSPGSGSGKAYAGSLGATWEIDLFGRIRRLTESARAQFFATEEARRDVAVSLIAQVAQDYFQLLSLDRELAIAREATNSYGASLKIFNDRLRGQVASRLETSTAQALLDSAAAMIPDFERQIEQTENQLGVLLGRNPQPIVRTGSGLENEMPPEVPAGLPSVLLERRPDIREAEQLLRSANALVGVAEADFFPDFSLTGLIGQVSPELGTITSGSAFAWQAAASLTGPLFHGGQLKAQYRQAKAARDQSALQYQQTVLNAFQEVSNALIAREKLALMREKQASAVAAYQEAARIAIERYRQGQSSYYEVLQEQQLLFPAETSLVQTEFNQLVAVVQLYRALGGGWNPADAQEVQKPAK